MEKFIIKGGVRIQGTIQTNSSKNATLPILAATLLNNDTSEIKGVPKLKDVMVMIDVLTQLGAKVKWNNHNIEIETSSVNYWEVPDELMRKMRASALVMGPLLARFGKVRISSPGGCQIGSRPMNLHLKGLQALGANVTEKFGYILMEAKNLTGTEIHLDVPSVGATENIMMAAVLARGTTIIRNAAREPEIVDLQNFLNAMGARIKGAGTDTIKIKGGEQLHSTTYLVIPDRIEAGTHLIAAAITGGDLTVTNVIPEHLEPLLAKLREMGFKVKTGEDFIRITGNSRPKAVDIKTMPYPGFPTDMQPQLMALLSLAEGTSIVSETIFENRFKHVAELRRMGANIKLEGQTAIIKGVSQLEGTTIEASDLRAAAALLLAAMAAENNSILENVEHLDRGYEQLEEKYNALGAKIVRVSN